MCDRWLRKWLISQISLSLCILWLPGCTSPELTAAGLNPGDYCYAQSSSAQPSEPTVRLTLSRQGRVSGEGQGFISDESVSYHARYHQVFTGQLIDHQLVLTVNTTLEANRDGIKGYPAQAQEQWLISANELKPKISPFPLSAVDCASIQQGT
jgi:hypothetical protein